MGFSQHDIDSNCDIFSEVPVELSSMLFYFLATLIVLSSLGVLLLKNPIYAALSLAGTMVSMGFLYFNIGAYFIAGVQLIVYAGAVMVLFVMVVMLFDLKKEVRTFTGGFFGIWLKFFSASLFVVLILAAIKTSLPPTQTVGPMASSLEQMASVKELGILIFTDYVFAFESLGVLLLLIAVGVVAVARSKGGTHAPGE